MAYIYMNTFETFLIFINISLYVFFSQYSSIFTKQKETVGKNTEVSSHIWKLHILLHTMYAFGKFTFNALHL